MAKWKNNEKTSATNETAAAVSLMMPAGITLPASSDSAYPQDTPSNPIFLKERDIEDEFIEKLCSLKYSYRQDICDRTALESNFRQKFETLNRVKLTDDKADKVIVNTIQKLGLALDENSKRNRQRTNQGRKTFIQRLKTQLDQYTDLTLETRTELEQLLPEDELNAFCGVYLDTAQRLKEGQGSCGGEEPIPAVDQLDFEFVLFASDDILFINAAEHFVKGKRQNQLTEEHIDKIVETYQYRREKERYSKLVSMERIAEEGYNLNISRYISTAVQEQEIALEATHSELVKAQDSIRKATSKHNKFLKELGLPLLPAE